MAEALEAVIRAALEVPEAVYASPEAKTAALAALDELVTRVAVTDADLWYCTMKDKSMADAHLLRVERERDEALAALGRMAYRADRVLDNAGVPKEGSVPSRIGVLWGDREEARERVRVLERVLREIAERSEIARAALAEKPHA